MCAGARAQGGASFLGNFSAVTIVVEYYTKGVGHIVPILKVQRRLRVEPSLSAGLFP